MSNILSVAIVVLLFSVFFYFLGRAMERVRMLGYVESLRKGYKVGLLSGFFQKDRLTHEKVLDDFEQLLQPYDRNRRAEVQAKS